jgi:hypothetical protein
MTRRRKKKPTTNGPATVRAREPAARGRRRASAQSASSRLDRSSGLAFYNDVAGWRCRERIEELDRNALARLPVFEAQNAARIAVAFDQAPSVLLHVYALRAPAVKP